MGTNSFDSDKFKDGQRQHWDSVAAGWKKWWETIEQFAQIVTDSLTELAYIKPDQQILDIATGIGEPALSVAKLVGENGKVVATDMSSQMLSIARDRASGLGLRNVEFQESDAEKLDFPEGHFDAIVCRWGLMFLPDVETTLKSALRMLVRDGKFASAVWDVPENIPFFSFAVQTLLQMFDVPMPPPEAPTVSGLAGGKIEENMANAGFTDIRTETITVNFEFSSAGEYTELMKDIAAPLRIMLANQSPEEQDEYWRTLEESTARKFASQSGGVLLPSISISVVGQRA